VNGSVVRFRSLRHTLLSYGKFKFPRYYSQNTSVDTKQLVLVLFELSTLHLFVPCSPEDHSLPRQALEQCCVRSGPIQLKVVALILLIVDCFHLLAMHQWHKNTE
jgi:hypothetical protein